MTKAKSMKSNKIIKMMMVCGASIAMLAPIAVSPLNGVMPNNVTANASRRRVRKSRKHLSRRQLKHNAYRLRVWFTVGVTKRFLNLEYHTTKPERKMHRARRILNKAQHNYSEKNDAIRAAKLARLEKNYSNSVFAAQSFHFQREANIVQSRLTKLLRHKHSKNPYVRKMIRRMSRLAHNTIREDSRIANNARHHRDLLAK